MFVELFDDIRQRKVRLKKHRTPILKGALDCFVQHLPLHGAFFRATCPTIPTHEALQLQVKRFYLMQRNAFSLTNCVFESMSTANIEPMVLNDAFCHLVQFSFFFLRQTFFRGKQKLELSMKRMRL